MRHAPSELVIFAAIGSGLLVILAWVTRTDRSTSPGPVLNDNQADAGVGDYTGGMGPRSYVRSVSTNWYTPVPPQAQTRYMLISENGLVDRYVSAHG